MAFNVAVGLIVVGFLLMIIFIALTLYTYRYSRGIFYLLPLLLALACASFSTAGTVAISTRPTSYVSISRTNAAKYTPVEDQDGYYLYSWNKYSRSEFHIYEWNGEKSAWEDTKHTLDNSQIVPYYLADGEEINPTVYSYDEALLSTHRFLFWDVPEREAKWVRRYYFRIPEKKHYTEP